MGAVKTRYMCLMPGDQFGTVQQMLRGWSLLGFETLKLGENSCGAWLHTSWDLNLTVLLSPACNKHVFKGVADVEPEPSCG